MTDGNGETILLIWANGIFFKELEIRKPDYYLDAYKGNLGKLLNDKKLKEELGKNGRKFLEENLNVEKTYQIIMKHFK